VNCSDQKQTVVIVDADNTLWDTDSVYAKAQLALLKAVEAAVGVTTPEADRLVFVRSLDQDLAERHDAGLRYPPRLLVRALALALNENPLKVAEDLAWLGGGEGAHMQNTIEERIAAEFIDAIKATPTLRPGVQEGLQQLRTAGCLILVMTEGSRDKVYQTANRHGLISFDRVMGVKKNRRLFERILRLSRSPSSVFMVGDQLARDIRPAKEAGLRTIYFPGSFRPRWEPSEAIVRPDYRVDSFAEVPDIVLAKCSSRPARSDAAHS
jgi:putative hydrolase of the HAD superfamily